MPHIHPSAVISERARIADDVVIGPFCVVEDDVEIQSGTRLMASVYVARGARIGRYCTIYPGAVIATPPQDLKYAGEATTAEIADHTVIRECVTIHRGTKASGRTVVGAHCLIMAYCHIAHDCVIGDRVIMANATQLGGHVTVEDDVVLGGATLIHQFCRIGRLAMTGAGTKITKDVAPFLLVNGNMAKVYGLNRVGLRRKGFAPQKIDEIMRFYKVLFQQGMTISEALEFYQQHFPLSPEVEHCIRFIRSSQRGVYVWRKEETSGSFTE